MESDKKTLLSHESAEENSEISKTKSLLEKMKLIWKKSQSSQEGRSPSEETYRYYIYEDKICKLIIYCMI